jgi:hypothetical protein
MYQLKKDKCPKCDDPFRAWPPKNSLPNKCPYCSGDETKCDFSFETERCSQMTYEAPCPQSDRDKLGRRIDSAPMPEALKDTIATCYGLLHGVMTDDKRVHRARRGLLQWLTKDEQARGIDMARGVTLMTDQPQTNGERT